MFIKRWKAAPHGQTFGPGSKYFIERVSDRTEMTDAWICILFGAICPLFHHAAQRCEPKRHLTAATAAAEEGHMVAPFMALSFNRCLKPRFCL
jgi:hypothetical protein